MGDPRLDKLLWSLRIFKTRPLATEACRAGRVVIGDSAAKPGRDVHVGEVLSIRHDGMTRTLRIVALPSSRLSAKLVPDHIEDLTPPAEYERRRQDGIERSLASKISVGKPSKRERKELNRLLDGGI
jgi:ribosome-associated heat shock protein Hsp15